MSWANEYYEIMEFYFYEPQHLECNRKVGNTLKLGEVLTSLRQKEVPLNHILNIGLHMLPSAALVKLLGYYVLVDNAEFVLQGGDILPRYKIIYPQFENFSQPDIFLSSPRQNIFIELKVKTKTKIEQYLKYLFLHTLDEKHCGYRKKMAFTGAAFCALGLFILSLIFGCKKEERPQFNCFDEPVIAEKTIVAIENRPVTLEWAINGKVIQTMQTIVAPASESQFTTGLWQIGVNGTIVPGGALIINTAHPLVVLLANKDASGAFVVTGVRPFQSKGGSTAA